MKWGHLLTRYRPPLGAAGLILLAAATWWMLVSGNRGTTYAVVLTFTVAVITLAVAVFGVPWQTRRADHARLVAAAHDLARDMATREADQQQRLLADTGQAQPADVGFRQPELVHWRADGRAKHGSLRDIKAFYGKLSHGRLVIVGEAGAGKTVLAGRLLLDLVTCLPVADSPLGVTMTVPVRVSLPSFNVSGGPEHTLPSEISADLDRWIARNLADVHGVPPRIARALVRHGWILPILDGLDEMDPSVGHPERAAAVIRALNHPSGATPRPVIITCRTERYRQLADAQAAPGQQPVLQDATVVQIQPLTSAQVSDYLTRRFPDPADPDRIQLRWQPVLGHITGRPPSPLTAVLSSPLYLFLAVTAYHDAASCPADLTKLPADSLEPHLLDKLIPAVISQHPKPGGSTYAPADVTRWLTTLASYLHTLEAEGLSGSDIDLHRLWAAAGNRVIRYGTASVIAIITGLLLLAVWRGYFHAEVVFPVNVPVTSGALNIAIVAYSFWRASIKRVALHRLSFFTLRTRAGRSKIAAGIAAGILGVIVTWRDGVSTVAIAISGLACCLTVLAAVGFVRRPAAISRPGQLIAQGIMSDLATISMVGLVFGLTSAVFAFPASGPDFDYGVTVALGSFFPAGLVFGLAVGVAVNTGSPWPRYFLANLFLAYRGRLPLRLGRFLDWAYAAGLLRVSGISTQFRHRKLQERLARIQPRLTTVPAAGHLTVPPPPRPS